MIARINDIEAEQMAEGLISGYTEAEEDDGTHDAAVEKLAYFLVRAVEDFNEELNAQRPSSEESNGYNPK